MKSLSRHELETFQSSNAYAVVHVSGTDMHDPIFVKMKHKRSASAPLRSLAKVSCSNGVNAIRRILNGKTYARVERNSDEDGCQLTKLKIFKDCQWVRTLTLGNWTVVLEAIEIGDSE